MNRPRRFGFVGAHLNMASDIRPSGLAHANDDLRPARGVAVSLFISAVIWAFVLAVLVWA